MNKKAALIVLFILLSLSVTSVIVAGKKIHILKKQIADKTILSAYDAQTIDAVPVVKSHTFEDKNGWSFEEKVDQDFTFMVDSKITKIFPPCTGSDCLGVPEHMLGYQNDYYLNMYSTDDPRIFPVHFYSEEKDDNGLISEHFSYLGYVQGRGLLFSVTEKRILCCSQTMSYKTYFLIFDPSSKKTFRIDTDYFSKILFK